MYFVRTACYLQSRQNFLRFDLQCHISYFVLSTGKYINMTIILFIQPRSNRYEFIFVDLWWSCVRFVLIVGWFLRSSGEIIRGSTRSCCCCSGKSQVSMQPLSIPCLILFFDLNMLHPTTHMCTNNTLYRVKLLLVSNNVWIRRR